MGPARSTGASYFEGSHAVIASLSIIQSVLAEALQPGPAIAPANLLAALDTEASPLEALMRAEGSGVIRIAIEQDYGFIRFLQKRPDAIDSDAWRRLAALIWWLLARLKDWKQSDDNRLQVLAALLLTSKLCGGQTGLWHLFHDENVPSAEFLRVLGILITKIQIVYGSRGTVTPPIWESEFADAFQKSDAAGDWENIAAKWQQFSDAIIPTSLFTEMVRCLARYAFGDLVLAADTIQQCPLTMQIASALSTEHRLLLANASESERVRFCCIFKTLATHDHNIDLPSNEEAALSSLLIKVSTYPEEWLKWMKAFNTYPLRYPPLYCPLGNALAHISYDSAVIYINSINLHPIRYTENDINRLLISDCLRVFSKQAQPKHRCEIWTYAYRRWCDWRFDTRNFDTNLFEISRSQLDFAVISYICECMNGTERENAFRELQKNLSEVELTWHPTETDCTTEWNRLLSFLQPYAHARETAGVDGDVLPDKRLYYPSNLSTSLYYRIMFRMQHHKNYIYN